MGVTLAIIVLILFALWMIPLGFGGLSPDGPYQILIHVNGHTLEATMENTKSSYAFKRMIEKQPKQIRMRDYGSMEKVGMLWRKLPSHNKQITAQPGDIILYMGRSIVVYYEPNAWNFTKIGHIDGIGKEELKKILGDGRVNMTFELSSQP